MPRTRVTIAVLGQPPADFDPRDLVDWSSSVIEIDPEIRTFQLNEDARGADWQYTDAQLERICPANLGGDFSIVLLSVKLEDNWYVRRLTQNRLLFTFYELEHILRFNKIPLINIVLRVLYSATLIYKRYGDRLPPAEERTNFAHDETRGCLFDMNASKFDVIRSLHRPILCERCIATLKQSAVPNEIIDAVRTELKNIQKPLFQRMIDFVHRNPIWSIVISLITALVIGTTGSLLASVICDALRAHR